MLTKVFSSPAWLSLIRSTPAFPYLDGFIAATVEAGFRPKTVQKHVRAAAHFSHWLERQGKSLTDVDRSDEAIDFKNQFATCQCAGFKRRAADDGNGAERFIQYLQDVGIITLRPIQGLPQPPLLIGFCQWMRQHRGVKEATLVAYGRIITDALRSLGEDPTQYDASALRAYVLDRAPKHGRSRAKLIVTTMRSFIRYLTAQGLCPVGLDAAIPTIAGWKLAALPRYLPATDVERIIASSDTTTPMGARDRAVLLLLARLGIRAGDVTNMRWQDIDWHQATIDITGCKSQRAVRLPLPQEVGDALLHHLANTPDAVRSDPIVLSAKPPFGTCARILRRFLYRQTRHCAGRYTSARTRRSCYETFRGHNATSGGCFSAEYWRTATPSLTGYDDHICQSRLQGSKHRGTTLAGGVAMMTPLLDNYLALRRATGFQLRVQEVHLRNYVKFATDRGDTLLRTQTALDWAALAPSASQRGNLLDVVRIFARYAKAEDSHHEVPPHGVYSSRRMPYRLFIINTDQIRQVLEYAAQLPPVGSLRPWTYCTLFSLLAVTGMRISEALALRFEDVTPEGLLIQKTKFQKSRLLPLHPSAQIGLDRYLQRRRCFGGFDDHVFISLRQKPS